MTELRRYRQPDDVNEPPRRKQWQPPSVIEIQREQLPPSALRAIDAALRVAMSKDAKAGEQQNRLESVGLASGQRDDPSRRTRSNS